MHPLKQLFDAPVIDAPRLWIDENELRRNIPILLATRAAVTAALEAGRRQKRLGSSLACSVVLQVDKPEALQALQRFEDELDTMFVVSDVKVTEGVVDDEEKPEWEVKGTFEYGTVVVRPPLHHKCGRCWRYKSTHEDSLCERCEDIVDG